MDYTAIFQGGGLKGLAYIGAIIALDEEGYVCKRAAGTSAGSIFASLLMSGYTGIELLNLIKEIDVKKLIKKEPSPVKGIINEKGLYSLYYIEKEIAMLLANKNIYNFKKFNNNGDYILKMTGTNITYNDKIIFPNDLIKYKINPDFFPVSTAIAMSSTYPLFFKPYKLNNMYIADGGILNNFPYDIFDYNDDELVFGFLLSNKTPKNIPENIKLIKLNTNKVKMLNFNINKKEQLLLIHEAYLDTKKQLREIFDEK